MTCLDHTLIWWVLASVSALLAVGVGFLSGWVAAMDRRPR